MGRKQEKLLKLRRRIKKVMHKEFVPILTGFNYFLCLSLLRLEILESMRDNH